MGESYDGIQEKVDVVSGDSRACCCCVLCFVTFDHLLPRFEMDDD